MLDLDLSPIRPDPPSRGREIKKLLLPLLFPPLLLLKVLEEGMDKLKPKS